MYGIADYPVLKELETALVCQVLRASLSGLSYFKKYPREPLQIEFHKWHFATSFINGVGLLQFLLKTHRKDLVISDLPHVTPTATEVQFLFYSFCAIDYLIYIKHCTR